ncbi:MAG: hypothetical protein II362_03825 [Alistipes sp.]|nr:hypothetical protein [Alistipes sp.]MBQ2392974.1 hypothetical protein [Alistipes sp.]MBQ5393833.1 hypothetical protein [Alistipes sp.]MBQ5638059.1 hypothetical protein [Alistipes sp.]MBQ5717915.1 hypothetical protein [Alistipes sp.]
MIVVISFILNLLAPIVNTVGLFGLIMAFLNDDYDVMLIGGGLAVVGFIFGIFAYGNAIPPRWFWSRSTDALFSFAVTTVLGYAWIFAAWPFAIYMVQDIIDRM